MRRPISMLPNLPWRSSLVSEPAGTIESTATADPRPAVPAPRQPARPVVFWPVWGLILVGFGLALAGQLRLADQTVLTPGLWLLLGGSLLAALAAQISARWEPVAWLAAWPGPRPAPVGRWPVWAIIPAIGAALLGLAAGVIWIAPGFTSPLTNTAALLWAGAVAGPE